MEIPKKPTDLNNLSLLDLADVSVTDLSLQLYRDYSSDRNPEKLFLVISEILSRGYEGRAALIQMSQGSDDLSLLAQKILESGEFEPSELEKTLGVKRFGDFVDLDDPGRTSKVYEHYRDKINPGVSFEQFMIEERERTRRFDSSPRPSHLTGEIENEVVIQSLTFGVTEPSYLELLGPQNLLRLKNIENQDMLLLGSYGTYSAREFRDFAKKITRNPKTSVLDINPLCVSLMKKDVKTDNSVVEGDARRMPFADESFDQIYTNHLFHFLGHEDLDQNQDSDVIQVLKEASRVLRPGGFLILDEEAFGEHQDDFDVHKLLYSMSVYANKFGLKSVRSSTSNWAHVFRPEIGTATVDDLGFPHYENSLLVFGRGLYARALFVKE